MWLFRFLASLASSASMAGNTCGWLLQDAWVRLLERTVVSTVPMAASPGCRPALLHDALSAGHKAGCRV